MVEASPFFLGLLIGAAISTVIACFIAWGLVCLLHRFGGALAVRIGGSILVALVGVLLIRVVVFMGQAEGAGPTSPGVDVQMALNCGTLLLLLVTLAVTIRGRWSRPKPVRSPPDPGLPQ